MTHISEIDATDGWLDHGDAWHNARKFGIGGSDACAVMRGNAEELEALRLQKTNGGKAPPAAGGLRLGAKSEDLSRVLPVQMGSWTEPLNRLWLSYAINMPVKPGIAVPHPTIHFMRANIDGVVIDRSTDLGTPLPIVECKHVNDFTRMEAVLSKYYAQLQHNIVCATAPCCYLSVFFGSGRHEWKRVDPDFGYIETMLVAEQKFWDHVISETPFTSDASPIEFVPLEKMRQVDMAGSNVWATHAADWLRDRGPAKAFDETTRQLKELIDDDVRRAFGAGIEVVRDKRGVSVRALISEGFTLKRSPQIGDAA